MSLPDIVETGAASLLWAAIFQCGGKVSPPRALLPKPGTITSLGAGMSIAYVFVHMMPELQATRHAFVASSPMELPYEGMGVYFLALVGFLAFYGLDYVRASLHETTAGARGGPCFRLHVGGFAAYVFMMGYLLVNGLHDTKMSVALYAVALGLHFLSVDRALHQEHGAAYDRVGRPVLAAMSVLGWGVGMAFAMPQHVLALLVAFVSGAIIMNSTIMEVHAEKGGRIMPMMFGGLVYGLILIPFG
jgi:hypothetical protein